MGVNVKRRIERRHSERCRMIKRAIVLLIAGLLAIILAYSLGEASAKSTYTIYTVKSGDTLWTIARDRWGDSCDIRDKIDDIRRINGMDDVTIYPGMQIVIEK